MLCAAAVTSQFVGGKAVRDALYLSHLDVTTLPAMIAELSGVRGSSDRRSVVESIRRHVPEMVRETPAQTTNSKGVIGVAAA